MGLPEVFCMQGQQKEQTFEKLDESSK